MARRNGGGVPIAWPSTPKALYPNGWPGNVRAVLYLNDTSLSGTNPPKDDEQPPEPEPEPEPEL